MVEVKDLVWKDRDSGRLNKILDIYPDKNDIDCVRYIDVGTKEEHVMSVDIFVTKYKACGLFDNVEHA